MLKRLIQLRLPIVHIRYNLATKVRTSTSKCQPSSVFYNIPSLHHSREVLVAYWVTWSRQVHLRTETGQRQRWRISQCEL